MHLKLMTKRRPHARKQFVHAEGLGDVIVGAEIERLDLADLVAAARQHHDRDGLVARAHHPQQFQALHVRQSKIENDEIGILRQQLERGLAVRRLQDVVALRAQAHAQQFADGRLVIDHENLERGRAHAAVSSCLVAGGTGNLIVKTAPGRSGRFAAVIVPCMASTKPREIARPSPVPARTRSPFSRPIELVEDVLEVSGRYAVAFVQHLETDRVLVAPAPDADGACRRGNTWRRCPAG